MRERADVWIMVVALVVSAAVAGLAINPNGDASQNIGSAVDGDGSAGPMSVNSIDLINQPEGFAGAGAGRRSQPAPTHTA